LLLNFLSAQFALSKNLSQQAASDGFAAMDGNDRASAVGVTKKMMTPLRSYHFKTKTPKHLDELNPADGWKRTHATIEIR
jgi:hypothetical protein